jgi:hypothetical protein
MKHRKGIDLTRGGRGSPIYVGELEDVVRDTRAMMEWECVGARCGKCGREVRLDRWKIQRGRSSIVLSQLQAKLKCDVCDNKEDNKIFLGRLPRD